MKIAIDARMIKMSGVGTYTRALLNQGIYEVALGDIKDIHEVESGLDVIEFDSRIYSIKEQLKFPSKALRAKKVDLLHVPHYNVPLFYRGALAVSVHDLIHLVLPEFLPNKLAYIYAKVVIGYAVRKAKVIFTVSEHSKKDIIKYFKVKPEKIVVNYLGADKAFVHKEISEVEYLREKYGVPEGKKVIMYVGNLKPHKNLVRLLQAYSKMNNRAEACVVLVGKAFENNDIIDTIAELGIEKSVVRTGIISHEELVDFYNLADVFAFPTLYEGFGIPPLEAMACGTPVVSSNTSSLPEVVGDAAITFDPYDVNAIKEALEKVLSDDALKAELIKKGYERVKQFSNDEVVEKTKKAFADIKG